MRNKWLLAVIAAQVNSFLVTGAATGFRFAGVDLFRPDLTRLFAYYHLNPFLFGLGMFVISLLVFVAFICITGIIKGVITKSSYRSGEDDLLVKQLMYKTR